MRIRLTRKFADVINGVDLTNAHTGQMLDLSQRDAEMLLAEGWAEREATQAGDTHLEPEEQPHTTPRRRLRRD